MNTSNWMSELRDDLTLKKICIPGSHDAGMYAIDLLDDNIPILSSLALTQGKNMKGQLEGGIRYFDLRPEYYVPSSIEMAKELSKKIGYDIINYEGVFLTYHGPKFARKYGDSIVNILNATVNFISKNTTETIILNFSHWENFSEDVDKKFIDTIIKYVPENYRLNTIGTKIIDHELRTLRGKIIILIDNDTMYNKCVQQNKVKGIFKLGTELSIYNDYSNKKTYSEMLVDQMKKFGTFNDNNQLFLLNWTLTPDDWNVVGKFASAVNPLSKITEYFTEHKPSAGVKDYADTINPRLSSYGHARDFFFYPNYFKQMVNIINGDYWDNIGETIVNVCIEITNNRDKKQESITLKSMGANECLDMASIEKAYSHPENGGIHQIWYKKHVRENIYRLQNAALGLYLRAATENFMSATFAWLKLKDANNHLYTSLQESSDDNLLWHFEPLGGDKYHIVSYRRKKDNEKADRLDGNNGTLYLHAPNDGNFQIWKEKKVFHITQ